MRCPYCGCDDTKVIDTRDADDKQRRRRSCPECGKRFTTYEQVERPELLVNKKDNTYERFDRNKLIQGLSFAVKKRPVPGSIIIHIADDIENMCLAQNRDQISTAEISDIVLSRLRDIDEVAYVRFASVNKDFDNVERFLELISELKERG